MAGNKACRRGEIIMKIESSAVALSAGSSQTSVVSKSEELRMWAGNAQITASRDSESGEPEDYVLSISSLNLSSVHKSAFAETIFEMSDEDMTKISLIQKMIEALTGKKLQFYLPSKYYSLDGSGNISGIGGGRGLGWGLSYQRHESVAETSSMSFSAKGSVQTADGREISFSLDLNVSRTFTSEEYFSFRAGDALIDPLVVNFAGGSAELQDRRFSFDLDNDGISNNVSYLKQGSGFLVLDKNGDGIINNGGELFGPATGNGFLELAAYDKDGNGWIDESDPIFDKLQIWTKNENGEDELFAVGQVGIGAIYVKGINSAFELKNSSNELQGKIRQTGVFLRENGTAGTLQYVDMTI